MLAKFSARLRDLRLKNNLRQEQVAKLVGVNPNAISTYENDTRQPSFEILIRLANLYRVTTDYLLGRTDTRSCDLSGLTEDEAALVCVQERGKEKRKDQRHVGWKRQWMKRPASNSSISRPSGNAALNGFGTHISRMGS